MCEDEIYQNGNVIYQSWISGVLLRNEWYALILYVCGMLVYKELTSIVIIVDSGVIRWLMTLRFLRKSFVSVIILGILCSRGWRMESTYREMCSVSVPSEDTLGLFGGLMCRLLALSISCVMLIKLSSVACIYIYICACVCMYNSNRESYCLCWA